MKYTLAEGDDWCGLYENESLIFEGHSISVPDILTHLAKTGHSVGAFSVRFVLPSWLDARGSLPININDVIWRWT